MVWWPATGLEVLDQPIAEWPAWLEPAKPAPAPKATRPAADGAPATLPAIVGLIRTVALAPQGQRNAVTYWAACRMRENVDDGKISAGLARELLLEAAARTGLSMIEAARTFDSAMRESSRG